MFRYVILLIVFLFSLTTMVRSDDDELINVNFNDHMFDLPRSIADGFTAFVIDDASENPTAGGFIQPPRTEIRLFDYIDMTTRQDAGWVNVYEREDLIGYTAFETYEQLRDLLEQRPNLNIMETLPTLYPFQMSELEPDQYREFFTNATYIQSEGYQGITFVYGRGLIFDGEVATVLYRVYFESVSADGERYLSAQVEGFVDFDEVFADATFAGPDDYMEAVVALFNNPDNPVIIDWLMQAERMFVSFDYAIKP